MAKQQEILSDSQIDNTLIALKQQEIAEQIRSNKVIEGILKDIRNTVDRFAGDIAEGHY